MTEVVLKPDSFFGHHGVLAHGPVLGKKLESAPHPELNKAYQAYEHFILQAISISCDMTIDGAEIEAIRKLTFLLNEYRNAVVPIFEERENSGQENLRSTILEEFFQLLLFPLTRKIRQNFSKSLVLGKANSYVSLTFSPRSFAELYENPKPSIHTKDQDFVLGCAITIKTEVANDLDESQRSYEVEGVVIPVVAIECKTYIERNMLDSCAGTAKRLKAAMPYCLYYVISEYMKMEDAYPELTDIDELFILTKKSNSERLRAMQGGEPIHEICDELIIDIYQMISKHLSKIWWSPEDALARGRVIARP